MFAKILYFVFEEDIPNDDSKGDSVPVEVRPLEKRPVAVSPTDSYKNALRYSPPSGSVAGIYDVEDRMKALLRQMESIESSDSSMPEMANLFELLPKVIENPGISCLQTRSYLISNIYNQIVIFQTYFS